MFNDYDEDHPSNILDRTEQVNWLTLECYDLANQDGSAVERVRMWEAAMKESGELPNWYDRTDRAFMVKRLTK